jgi:hypothetical protein
MLGTHQTFSWLKIVENERRPSSDFWIENHKKCMVVAKHFLNERKKRI